MAKILKGVIAGDPFKELMDLEKKFSYICGKSTAVGKTKEIKENLQADPSNEVTQSAIKLMRDSLLKNNSFVTATHPSKLSVPLFAKYDVGMSYGFHYDLPIMKQGTMFRTDISCTVFLNDDYEGGELEIKTDYGVVKLKGKAGDALIYPSGSYHRVAEVTKGQRKVAVFWVQSRIQDTAQRELVYDMAKSLSFMTNENKEESAYAYAKKSYDNLLRMWSNV